MKAHYISPLPALTDLCISGIQQPIPNILLRQARKHQGWTQREVANRIQVSIVSVGRWERGEVFPHQYERALLCHLFQKSEQELGFSQAPSPQHARVNAAGQNLHHLDEALPPSKPHSFHTLLRQAREMRGLSQADLAARVACDTKTIARWENGKALPQLFFRRVLMDFFQLSASEFGLMISTNEDNFEKGSIAHSTDTPARPYRTPFSFSVNIPLHPGDCEQPSVTGTIETVTIAPDTQCTTLAVRFMNHTSEDMGLLLENLSLSEPTGKFHLGRSIGSFLLEAKQSLRIAVVFEWLPQPNLPYRGHIVLTRPGKWRNTYQPPVLTF